MKISFKSHPDKLEQHVKQVMRENYAAMETAVVNNGVERVNKEFRREFDNRIGAAQNEVGKNDLLNILGTLKDAYNAAGMQKDSEAVKNQITRLDVRA